MLLWNHKLLYFFPISIIYFFNKYPKTNIFAKFGTSLRDVNNWPMFFTIILLTNGVFWAILCIQNNWNCKHRKCLQRLDFFQYWHGGWSKKKLQSNLFGTPSGYMPFTAFIAYLLRDRFFQFWCHSASS